MRLRGDPSGDHAHDLHGKTDDIPAGDDGQGVPFIPGRRAEGERTGTSGRKVPAVPEGQKPSEENKPQEDSVKSFIQGDPFIQKIPVLSAVISAASTGGSS
ncbi:hypothetical protein MASR2M79_12540 [Aminivibrio sp.]